MATFRTTDGNKHPITSAKGVTEQSFREGEKNILGTPSRQFSSGIPMTERASFRTKLNYAKNLTKRFDEATASGKARKAEKNREKDLRNKEADRNLELASLFFNRQNAIRKGQNLPPIDVNVNVDTQKPVNPKNLSKEEQDQLKKLKQLELQNESNMIEKINTPTPPPPRGSSPAMPPKPILTSGEPDTSESGEQTEEHYAYAASPAYTTQGEHPKKPDKSKISLSEMALLKYPASG